MLYIKRLFGVLDNWKWHYQLAGLLVILSSLIRMLEPKLLQLAIDGVLSIVDKSKIEADLDPYAAFLSSFLPAVTEENLANALLGIGFAFIILSLGRVGTEFLASIISAYSTENAIKNLRDKMFRHIQLLPITIFGKIPSAEMIQRSTGDVDTVRKFISNQVVEVIRLTAIFVAAFFMMVSVHTLYAFISIALIPFIVITAYLFFKKEGKVWEEHEMEQDKLTAIVKQNLTGIRVVKAFAKEEFEIDKFERQNQKKLKVGLKHVYLHQNFWTFSDLLINIQITLSLLAGAYFTLYQEISVGEFVSFFTYCVVVTWPMRQVGRIVSEMGMAVVAMQRMTEILDAEEEDYKGSEPQGGIRGEIEFQEVTFRYDRKKEEYALRQVSFKINAGEQIAFMGPAGSGKTTVIELLARFYEPESGSIFLDGKPLTSYSKTYLRKSLGIVHQKPFLFSTTIKQNMAFANKEADEETIQAAAAASTVSDFAAKMPDGLNTIIGENGVTLSGGQKQRVSLARTLLQQPSILVLDDATSSVDTETEHFIQNALLQYFKDKTSIIIAHRLTSLQFADRIMVFEEGKMIEEGSQASLLKKDDGFFKQVYDIQSSIEDAILKEIKGE